MAVEITPKLQTVRDTLRTLYDETTVIVTVAADLSAGTMITASNALDSEHMLHLLDRALNHMGLKIAPIEEPAAANDAKSLTTFH